MKYFNSIATIEELKAEYRRLALANHPDKGGDTETMKEINAEFDLAFSIAEKRAPRKTADSETETSTEFKRRFYTEFGWAGSRFKPGVPLKEIAPIIRSYLRDVYPSWKFSVRKENYNGFYVTLMEAPADIFTEGGIQQWAREQIWKRRNQGTEDEVASQLRYELFNRNVQNWSWYYNFMTDRAREVLKDIEDLVNSYRFDDSDARFDYFNTNFYPSFDIGQWNKPFKIVPKRERIQTSEGPEGAMRITA